MHRSGARLGNYGGIAVSRRADLLVLAILAFILSFLFVLLAYSALGWY